MDAVLAVYPFGPVHRTEAGAEPPLMMSWICPLLPVLHAMASPLALVGTTFVVESGCGSVSSIVVEVVHPFASSTFSVYVPASSPVGFSVVLLKAFGPVHRMVYGAVPPVIAVIKVPSAAPVHETFVDPYTEAEALAARVPGAAIVLFNTTEHPLASLTFTE